MKDRGRMAAIVVLILATAGVIVFLALRDNKDKTLAEEFFAMDTVMDITLIQTEETDADLADIMNELRDRIYQMDRELSVTNPASDVAKLNAAAGENVAVSDDAWELIRTSVQIAEETKEPNHPTFDPTLYPIVKLWGFTTGEYRVPTEAEIQKELKKVGYGNIKTETNAGVNEVSLENEAQIDLGACAKGFLSDALCGIMRTHRVNGLVSLGGNVQTVGTKEDGEDFVIGIADPIKGDQSIFTKITARDKAVVTSGNYERYFERDGMRYHHIMDSKTGAPVDNDLASVTVIGPNGCTCDAYATALYVMGGEAAKQFISDKPEYALILIYRDGHSWKSDMVQEK